LIKLVILIQNQVQNCRSNSIWKIYK